MTAIDNSRDEYFMRHAAELAKKGWCSTHPNPRVGCVIVHEGKILGEGWHERAGEAHAEVRALANLRASGHDAKGATVYVTLEPCSHYGRTPPCAEALIQVGVARVVIGARDPNPKIDGRGIQKLRDAGIEVVTGIEKACCEELNLSFNHRMRTGLPRVRVKLAMSLDGRTAAADGSSQWITGQAAREDVHYLRAEAGAVMTGRGTLEADDPRLTVRLPGQWRQPLRVVLDSKLVMGERAGMLSQPGKTLVITASRDQTRHGVLNRAGAEIAIVPSHGEGLDLSAVMRTLADRGINDVLVEAGPTLAGALGQAGWVDEWIVYVAPLLIGDTGRGLVTLSGVLSLHDARRLTFGEIKSVGADFRIAAYPSPQEKRK